MVVMESSVFYDITLHSPLKINWYSKGIFQIHLQGRARYLLQAGFLRVLFFRPEDGGDIFLPNIGLFSTDYMVLYHRK
jgi:hypothetical protein